MVFPLKDTMPAQRAPGLTLALLALTALVFAVAAEGGWAGPGGVAHAAVTLLVLWIFGATLEDTLGRAAFAVLVAAGAGTAVAVLAAAGGGTTAGLVAASGAASVAAGAHLALYPRGRVLCASFVPLFFTMVEVPAWVLAALWAIALVLVSTWAGAATPPAAALGAFMLGLGAARLIARPKPIAPAPYRVA